MLQLNPGETYTVNRILKDWADNTTYYVRAVVYDATTRASLSTLDLTDNGSRWFSKTYQVPTTGQTRNGRRLIVVTSVYTDSGYSSRSNNHYDEVEEILVLQHLEPAINFGGGDGGWDYKVLLKEMSLLMDKKLADFAGIDLEYDEKGNPKPLAEPVRLKLPEAVDLEGASRTLYDSLCAKINEYVSGLSAQIAALPKPEKSEKTDLKPIMQGLSSVLAAINNLPKPERVNFEPLLIQIARQLNLLKQGLSDEIAMQGSKELTLSFGDTPEERKRKTRKSYLEGLKIKHGIK